MLINGNFLGIAALYVDPNGFDKLDKDGKPEIKKDANGQPIIATKDDKASWVPTGEHTEYPEQGSPDLTKYGYKKVRALDSRTEDDNDGGKVVDHKDSDPTKDGADVNVYYFHDQEDVTTDKPGFDIDVKELKKTFIRTIIYRGTRDEGKTYQDVNGSPDSTHVYKQSVTFTRKAIIDSVTKKVVRYTDWTSDKPEMDEAPSKKPSEVGYDKVDKAKVAGISVNPDSDKTDLGLIVVTYTAVVPDGGGSTGGDNGGKEQQPPKDEDKTPNLDKKPEKSQGSRKKPRTQKSIKFLASKKKRRSQKKLRRLQRRNNTRLLRRATSQKPRLLLKNQLRRVSRQSRRLLTRVQIVLHIVKTGTRIMLLTTNGMKIMLHVASGNLITVNGKLITCLRVKK
nr:mucus-binding protein [Lactobacillus helveticus]